MLKKGDRVYSWYSHREGKIVKINKFETCIVLWDTGTEQKVPLPILRKIPTKQAIYNELRYAYKNNISFDKVFPIVEKEYGDRALPILEETIESFKVRTGDIFTNNKNIVKVADIKEHMCEIEYRDGTKTRLPKRELILNWEKSLDEEDF